MTMGKTIGSKTKVAAEDRSKGAAGKGVTVGERV
jgi:hypothetical protein